MATRGVRECMKSLRTRGNAVVLFVVMGLVLAVLPSPAGILPASTAEAAGPGVTVEYTVTVSEPPEASIQIAATYSGISSPLDLALGFTTYGPAIEDVLEGLSFVSADGTPIPHSPGNRGTVRVSVPAGQTAVTATYSINLANVNTRATWVRSLGAVLTGYEDFLVPAGQKVAAARVRFILPEPWQAVAAYSQDGEWFDISPVTFADLAQELKSSGWFIGTIAFDKTVTYDDGYEVRVVGFKGFPWRHWTLDSGGSPLDAALRSADFYHEVYVRLKGIFGSYPHQRQVLIGPDIWQAGTTMAVSLAEPPWQYESIAHHMVHAYFGPCEGNGSLAFYGAFGNTLREGYTTYSEGYLSSEITGDAICRGMLYERKIHYLRAGHFDNLEQDASSYVYQSIRTCAIDQEMRRLTGGVKGIDDLMAAIWRKYATPDFAWVTDEQILSTLKELTGTDWTAFYSRVVTSNALDTSPIEVLKDDFPVFLDAIAERWYGGHPSAYFLNQEIVCAQGSLTMGVRFQDPTRLIQRPSIGSFAAEARGSGRLGSLSVVLSESEIEEILRSLTGKDHSDFFEFYRGLGFTVDPADITEFVRSFDGMTNEGNQAVRATPRGVVAGEPAQVRVDVLDEDFATSDRLVVSFRAYPQLDGQLRQGQIPLSSLPQWIPGAVSGPGVQFWGADFWQNLEFGPGIQAHFEVPLHREGSGSSRRLFTQFTLTLPKELPLVSLQLNGRRGDLNYSGEFIGTEKVCWGDTVALDIVPERFGDIGTDNLFLSDIDYLARLKIVAPEPDGRFRPAFEITRAELAEWLVNAGGVSLEVPDPGFPDVPATHPQFRYIAAARASGIIKGHEDGAFHPDDPVTRAQMAAMIVRAFGLPEAPEASTAFTDVPVDMGLAQEIYRMAAAGIARGYPDGTFHPDQHTPREQAAAFVARAARWTVPWAMAR